ncbi:hypothetical protein M426DRAFT_326020 [Hypoxylon sp. CI-4A]|nr:hypothetical protein M426DRAFT_326020 [Hypoxylon sp. CI-4A]
MNTASLSSRRFACDRCRGQKLRCLKERSDQERCDRCLRADAECLTTPTLLIQNRTGDDLGSITRKRQRRHNSPAKQRTPSAAYHSEVGYNLSSLGVSLSASPDVQSNSVPAPPEFSQTWDTTVYDAELDSFEGIQLSSMDYISSLVDTDAQKHPSFDPIEAPRSEDLSLIHISNIPSTSSGSGGTSSQRSADRVSRETMSVALNDFIRTQNQNQDQDNLPKSTTFTDSFPHRLSLTNLKLLAQLGRVELGSPRVNLDMLITRSDESDSSTTTPIDDILSGTREFISILEDLSQTSRFSTSPSLAGDTPYGLETGVENTPPGLSPSGSSARAMPSRHSPSFEVTTQLLVLSCYVHVLRLYVILFAHIRQFLEEIADSDDPTLCAIPDLGFGNFPLQSGNLQATMFIQISTSLFEKIESLLGLPQGLRVTVRDGKPEGLLSEVDFVEVVKAVLAKDEQGQPEHGKGGVKSLRKNMKQAMQLLRESIAP